MKRRSRGSAAASAAAENCNGNKKGNLVSPRLPIMSSRDPDHSPQVVKSYDDDDPHYNINLTLLRTPMPKPTPIPCSSPLQKPNSIPKIQSISELREIVSSRTESMKREMEYTHSALFKEMEASSARLTKRCKLQTQTCTQQMDEADREWKKFSDRYKEDGEDIQATCTELIAEAQSSGSRICKNSIPEMMRCMEKSIQDLRSRYCLS